MKVFIYDNKEKDSLGLLLKKLVEILNAQNIKYQVLEDEDLVGEKHADAIFSLGGDGTILFLTEFANKNGIPIIGINAGKLGFLTEFERYDMEKAVRLLKDDQLKRDERITLTVEFNGKKFYALNDVFVQRTYSKEVGCMIADTSVYLDGSIMDEFKGDGIIVGTSTGSTAYSLSAGGPILTPQLEAFVITPIAAHSITQRSVVYNSDSTCVVKLSGRTHAGLFVDGNYVGEMVSGDKISIVKADSKTTFLRKKDFDFFNRLSEKMKNNTRGV